MALPDAVGGRIDAGEDVLEHVGLLGVGLVVVAEERRVEGTLDRRAVAGPRRVDRLCLLAGEPTHEQPRSHVLLRVAGIQDHVVPPVELGDGLGRVLGVSATLHWKLSPICSILVTVRAVVEISVATR